MDSIEEQRLRPTLQQFENDYLTEKCSGFEAGSNLMLIDFVYHSALGLRVTKKKKKVQLLT